MKTEENINYIQISFGNWVEAILVFLGFIMSRPMILGNNYSPIGLLILLLVVAIELFKTNWKIKRDNFSQIYLWILIFFFYCGLSCVLLQSDRMQVGLQTVIYLIGCGTAFYVVGKNQKLKVAFIRVLYVVLSAFVISYIVSVVLMFRGGWDSILLFDYDYGYFTKSGVYFPFTTTYGHLPFNGIIFKRLLGFARESGIMQLFYIWGFYMCDKYFNKTVFLRVMMCLGIAACLSTTGFIVFAISLIFFIDIRKIIRWKTLVAIGLILISIYVLFYANGISISTRVVTTITDRTDGLSAGFEAFAESPILGKGFYDTLGYDNIQVGVSALSSLGQIGIIGFILWLSPYIVLFRKSKNKQRFLYAMLPILITGGFAQPLLAAPATYVFYFMDYDDDRWFISKGMMRVYLKRR